MPLNKDILGTDLYNKANDYNEVNIEDMEAARLAFWKKIAEGIIEHFKTNGVITVDTIGTSTAQHGTGTIT